VVGLAAVLVQEQEMVALVDSLEVVEDLPAD
jgi:hypothetical protein